MCRHPTTFKNAGTQPWAPSPLTHHVLHQHGDQTRQELAQQLRLQLCITKAHPKLAALQRHTLVIMLITGKHVLYDLVDEGLELVGLDGEELDQTDAYLAPDRGGGVVCQGEEALQVAADVCVWGGARG